MPRQDQAVRFYRDRTREAEFLDRGRDLPDLRVAVIEGICVRAGSVSRRAGWSDLRSMRFAIDVRNRTADSLYQVAKSVVNRSA